MILVQVIRRFGSALQYCLLIVWGRVNNKRETLEQGILDLGGRGAVYSTVFGQDTSMENNNSRSRNERGMHGIIEMSQEDWSWIERSTDFGLVGRSLA